MLTRRTRRGDSGEEAGPPPLSRNRAYHVLWTSQLLSELSIEVVAVAVPLLVLAASGSPLQLGVASAAAAAASLLAVIPAGVLADRWDRRRLLVCSQALRATAMTVLVVVLATRGYVFGAVLTVLVLEGVLAAVFDPVEHATLPRVVPVDQRPTAVARNAARPFVAGLLGPAAAGVLFAGEAARPFLAVALLLAVSTVALLTLRIPAASMGDEDVDDPDDDLDDTAGGIGDAVRWAAARPPVRAALTWTAASNLLLNSLVVLVLTRSHRDGVGPGGIGLTMSLLGAGGLLGGALAARAVAVVPGGLVMIACSWALAAGTFAMALVPAGVPLGLVLAVAVLPVPVANTVVLTHLVLVAPDRLRGRLSGLVAFGSAASGALGPLAGGLLASLFAAGPSAAPLLVLSAVLGLVAAATTGGAGLRGLPKPANGTRRSSP